RAARIRLDKSPLSAGKLLRKTAKHIVWLLIALATGGAWVFYFADAPTLAVQLLSFDAPAIAWLFIGLFTLTTYTLGAIAREQVCIYMCPWPRIQGAMFDEDSLLVSYREDRGEKRGPHKKGTSWEGRGDCIDCGQCVAACPMGIDIRDGMQLECIQCALCIDACNEIMDKVERPRGLITYDTFRNQERRKAGETPRLNILRPRTILYSVLLVLVSAIMLFGLSTRSTLDVSVLADRNPLFVVLSDGGIRNGYQLKILNKEHTAHDYRISISGLDGATLTRSGHAGEDETIIHVEADSLANVRLFVSLPAALLDRLDGGEAEFAFIVTDIASGKTATRQTNFRGPVQ
ncbi:MAG: cytochrome c oxidase accessory protein CcoG, partial [Pseudomonadota bacterium]